MKLASLSAHWHTAEARPLLLGHRGASHAAPENTFAAFDLALQEGAEGVELDVRLNASGQAVVVHDETLERVTSGRDPRAIHTLSSSECQAVRLEDGQRLPTLAEVLNWAVERRACVNIELKGRGRRGFQLARAVATAIAQMPEAMPWLLISSFNASLVLALRRRLPQVPGAWLIDSELFSTLPWLPAAAAVHPRAKLITQAKVHRWHRQGLRVHAWTVDDPDEAQRLAAAGVNTLISNHPATLLTALGG